MLRVLSTDDEQVDREFLLLALKALGHGVAASANEAGQ